MRSGQDKMHDVEHYSDFAERYVLGAIIQDEELAIEILAALVPDDFLNRQYMRIFEACIKIANDNNVIDLVSVTKAIQELGMLAPGQTIDLLTDLLEETIPTLGQTEQAIDVIKDNSMKRRLLDAASGIIDDVNESGDPAIEILGRAIHALDRVGETASLETFRPIGDIAKEVSELLKKFYGGEEAAMGGLATGFQRLDDLLLGLHGGELIIIAARPSVGKTALALHMARKMAHEGHNIAFFSLEMSMRQLAIRLICAETNTSMQIFTRQVMGPQSTLYELEKGTDSLCNLNLFIDDAASMNINTLRARSRRILKKQKIDIIFVDYLQLLHGNRKREGTREQEISSISKGLKELSKELNIPIVALAQLNRRADSGSDLPRLSHLRESGAIEQDADVVIFLHDEKFDERIAEAHQDENNGLEPAYALRGGTYIKLILAKQRNGPRGIIDLLFESSVGRFEEMEEGVG